MSCAAEIFKARAVANAAHPSDNTSPQARPTGSRARRCDLIRLIACRLRRTQALMEQVRGQQAAQQTTRRPEPCGGVQIGDTLQIELGRAVPGIGGDEAVPQQWVRAVVQGVDRSKFEVVVNEEPPCVWDKGEYVLDASEFGKGWRWLAEADSPSSHDEAAAGGAACPSNEDALSPPAAKPDIAAITHIRYTNGKWEAQEGWGTPWYDYTEAELGACGRSTLEKAKASGCKPIKVPRRGGSVYVSKKKLKNEFGLPVVKNTGSSFRLCAAHAAFQLVHTLRPELKGPGCSEGWFEQKLPGTLDAANDNSSDEIMHVVAEFDVVLKPVDPSPHALIQHGTDVFLVHMVATVNGDDICHFFVYDAASGCLLDPDGNNRQVEDTDRCLGVGKSQSTRKEKNRQAMRVFYEAYEGADEGSIKLDAIWRCVRGTK